MSMSSEREELFKYLRKGVNVLGAVVVSAAVSMAAAPIVGTAEVNPPAIERVEFTEDQKNERSSVEEIVKGTAENFYFAEVGEEYSEEDKARFIKEQLQQLTDYEFPLVMPEYNEEDAFAGLGRIVRYFERDDVRVGAAEYVAQKTENSAENTEFIAWLELETILYDLKFKTPDEVLDEHSIEVIGGVGYGSQRWQELAELVDLINKEAEKI